MHLKEMSRHSIEGTGENHGNSSMKIAGTLVVSNVTIAPTLSPSQSQSHVTTDGQSFSLSWCRALIEAHGHYEDLDVDCRIILKWILQKYDRGRGLHSSRSGQRPMVGSCETGNKPLGSIKCWKFFEGLNNG
jgi:hypothetical protein